MDLQTRYSLKTIINARGTFTPLGVSRSSAHVANITAQALAEYFDMDELQQLAGQIIASHCGAQFATITNCASAAITLSIAACMSGTDHDKISRLPDAGGMNNKVVIAASHNVNYGHPIEQDIRLAGSTAVFAGDEKKCSLEQLKTALGKPGIAALLYVESRLTGGNVPNLKQVVLLAHANNVPVIVDGAAQDMRMAELVASNADLLVFSAQKYLAAPTAGIVVGKKHLVDAVHAQIRGIGRAMKAGKEAIMGTIAAIEQRQQMDMEDWSRAKKHQATQFADRLGEVNHVTAELERDPSGGNFYRITMTIDDSANTISADSLAQKLQQGTPAIHCNAAKADQGKLNFEILALNNDECEIILEQIRKLLADRPKHLNPRAGSGRKT